MTPRILIKFASRSRPSKFFACLDNILQQATTDNFVILCSLDTNDGTMNNWDVRLKLQEYDSKVLPSWGISKNKVHAINRDISIVQNWDILINTSDDMWFIQKGFDQIIIDDFNEHFPDLDGVLHYYDGNPDCKSLMTMSIIGRKYYERDQFIYCPDYYSLWCDNEATTVAQLRGKYKYMGDNKILFHHNHPMHKDGFKQDDLMRHTQTFFWKDKKTFERRKRNNFFLQLKQVA